MYAATSREPMDLVPFPSGLDVHWETEKRVIWNEQKHVNEEEELVYEVSWICEIGVWRRFLRSRRKVQK